LAKKSLVVMVLLVYMVSTMLVFVPGVSAATYLVQPGDSLWKISRMYGTSVNAIKEANNHWSDTIYINQRLEIPTTTSSLSSKDIDLLAHLIHAEARGESFEGKVAVGAVVLNRVKSPLFPDTIAAVIYQTGQFSPVADGSINLEPDAESIRAAHCAASGWDPTGGALFFYNPAKVSARNYVWSRPVETVIGNHTFAK
jgi:N-acetylmuramoyl-L-alanine amidase